MIAATRRPTTARARPSPTRSGWATAPVVVDVVSDVGLARIGLASAWFHRDPVDVLQLVWPPTSGVFAWQLGAPPDLDEAQPSQWRVASPRTSRLAADPPWPFPAGPDALAIVCTHMRQQNAPATTARASTNC